MVHRLLAAAEGYAPLPSEYTEREFMTTATDVMVAPCFHQQNMNVRHRNAQLAGRDSVELFTLIFFNQKNETATGVIMNCKKNGVKVWVPKYGIEGTIFINNTNKVKIGSIFDNQKNELNHNYNNEFDFDPETCVLTNKNDPNDTLETFQPVTVGIHVQEMKGYRKELILSLLASHAFDEENKKKREGDEIERERKRVKWDVCFEEIEE